MNQFIGYSPPQHGASRTSVGGHAMHSPWWRLFYVLLFLIPLLTPLPASAGDMVASKVKIRAVADNVTVETMQGKTSKRSFAFFIKKETVQDQVGTLDIGVVDVGERAHVVGVNIDISVQVSNVYVKGATARIGSLYFR